MPVGRVEVAEQNWSCGVCRKMQVSEELSSDLPSSSFCLALTSAQLCQGRTGRTRVT